jgi:hypothetical protein
MRINLGSAPLRIRIIGTEKSSGQATQNYLNHISQDRTSAQPQANLSLLRSNSLKFQPLNSPWGKVHHCMLWPKGIELFTEYQVFPAVL